jgi:hypothetical protein
MTSTRSVVLSRPVRTAIGTFGGSLKDTAATELGAAAISSFTTACCAMGSTTLSPQSRSWRASVAYRGAISPARLSKPPRV